MDRKGNRIATIELSIPDFNVLQCRGQFNKQLKENHHIINLIEEHKKEFINCVCCDCKKRDVYLQNNEGVVALVVCCHNSKKLKG